MIVAKPLLDRKPFKMGKTNKQGKKFVTIFLAVTIVAVLLWKGSSIISFFSKKEVVVAEMQATSITIHDVQYSFIKERDNLFIFPSDNSHYPNSCIISPKVGETYQWLSIRITIKEIHQDRFVLLVESGD